MQITKYIDQSYQENAACQNFQYEIMVSKNMYVCLNVPVKEGGGEGSSEELGLRAPSGCREQTFP